MYTHARARTHTHTQAQYLKVCLVVVTAGNRLSLCNSRNIPVLRSVLQSRLFQIKLYLLVITTAFSVVISFEEPFQILGVHRLVEH